MTDITYDWSWTEAFEQHGFGSGNDTIHTPHVTDFLSDMGYIVETTDSIHNTYIISLQTPTGIELLDADKFEVGFDDPRDQLPEALTDLLDEEFE